MGCLQSVLQSVLHHTNILTRLLNVGHVSLFLLFVVVVALVVILFLQFLGWW